MDFDWTGMTVRGESEKWEHWLSWNDIIQLSQDGNRIKIEINFESVYWLPIAILPTNVFKIKGKEWILLDKEDEEKN